MDGKRCPLKADESQDRERKRRHNLDEARKLKAHGKHHVAEEKYRGCIRIKNDFAEAVMKNFRDHLGGEPRVIIVSAPYEADAQLIKLCIDQQADAIVTEDSDVLLYSAAAHAAVPVLFKLDRQTGNCQKISMEFLLSMSPADADKATKTNNKLESMIRNLASRQGKRKGFGVRLFIQACVLGGCDYSINNLDGVGLVGAFKLVRDNAFRNDNVRFRKILQSLPNKIKKKLNIDEYEERLAKSEAIFYYHLVSHLGGDVKPLLVPRISSEENPQEHDHTNHYPFMKRFEGDWSFLGDEASSLVRGASQIFATTSGEDLYVANAPRNQEAIGTKSNFFDKPLTTKRPPGPIHNPYKKLKTQAEESKRAPLEERNVNNLCVTKISVTEQSRELAQNELDMIKYFEDIPDPRYVKRKFSEKKLPKSTTQSILDSDTTSLWKVGQSEGRRPDVHRWGNSMFAEFQNMLNSQVGQAFETKAKHNAKQPNSQGEDGYKMCQLREEDAASAVQREPPSHNGPAATSNVISSQSCATAGPNSQIDLTSSDDENVIAQNHVAHTSKYFRKTNDPRRVTLGASDEDPSMRPTKSPQILLKNGSVSPHENDWDSDDIVESPMKHHMDSHVGSTFRSKNSYDCNTSGMRQKQHSKPKAIGPLLAGFQRQQQFFGHLKHSSQRTFTYSSAGKALKMKSLTAYFPSPETAEVKKRPHFNQLALTTNQSDEDFLWNG
jgi:5'-3' exonuclease